MTKWIKPSELPDKFHGSCWLSYKGWTSYGKPVLRSVQNCYRNGTPEFYADNGGWEYLSDESYRLIPIEPPSGVTDEQWYEA